MRENFLIVGTQRTGSQALYKALNFHPDVFCGGEWIQHVAWYRKIDVTKRALAGELLDVIDHPKHRKAIVESFTPDVHWLGFKILFRSSGKWLFHPRFAPALFLDRFESHLAWLRNRPDIHVIHLVRSDVIEWLKSKQLSRATGMFTHRRYPERMKVTVQVHQALRAASAKVWVDSSLSTLASSNPYHRVYYEDFLSDNRRALESCLKFLRCDSGQLPDDLQFIKRQSTGTAADYISNYGTLTEALKRRNLLVSNPDNIQGSALSGTVVEVRTRTTKYD